MNTIARMRMWDAITSFDEQETSRRFAMCSNMGPNKNIAHQRPGWSVKHHGILKYAYIKMNPGSFFTVWSAGWLCLSFVLRGLTDDAFKTAAAANSIAVGLLGPMVVLYGNIKDVSRQELLWSNAFLHALPMYLAQFVKRGNDKRTILYLFLFDILWLTVPEKGKRFVAKVRDTYGVKRPYLWVFSVLVLQMFNVSDVIFGD